MTSEDNIPALRPLFPNKESREYLGACSRSEGPGFSGRVEIEGCVYLQRKACAVCAWHVLLTQNAAVHMELDFTS